MYLYHTIVTLARLFTWLKLLTRLHSKDHRLLCFSAAPSGITPASFQSVVKQLADVKSLRLPFSLLTKKDISTRVRRNDAPLKNKSRVQKLTAYNIIYCQ